MHHFDTRYSTAMREKICSVCPQHTREGTCGLPYGVLCPIELYLAKIVEMVHDIPDEDLDDYLYVVRKNVCMSCPNQRLDGGCPMRESSACPLDLHFMDIAHAIKGVDTQIANEHSAGNAILS